MTVWLIDIQVGDEGTLLRLYAPPGMLVATRELPPGAWPQGQTMLSATGNLQIELMDTDGDLRQGDYTGRHRPETVGGDIKRMTAEHRALPWQDQAVSAT